MKQIPKRLLGRQAALTDQLCKACKCADQARIDNFGFQIR